MTRACLLLALCCWLVTALSASSAFAQPPLTQDQTAIAPTIPADTGPELRQFTRARFDAGDIAWILFASLAALLLLAPGLLFFYCGLLGIRNVPALMSGYLLLAATLSVTWVLWTYSLAFARNVHSRDVAQREIINEEEGGGAIPIIGGFEHVALRGLGSRVGNDSPVYPLRRPSDRIPHLLFMMYQMMFFIAVPVPLVVVFSQRMRAGSIALFTVIWGTMVYAPLAYWVWGGGWHNRALDSAGAIPAHISVGFAALAAAFLLGKPAEVNPVRDRSNPTFLVVGTALFWGGCLVWNASRALAANGFAASAFAATHMAASAGLIGWAGTEWLRRGKAGLVAFCAGPVAGLITISAGSGYVAPQSSIIIGVVGGAVCFFVHDLLERRAPQSDLLHVFSLHAIAATMGIMLTGVFATSSVGGFDQDGHPIEGLIGGNSVQLARQAAAAGSAIVLASVGSLVALLVVRLLRGFRPAIAAEDQRDLVVDSQAISGGSP